MTDPVLIVGAGLAGLSAALHLEGIPYRIVESAGEVGGLCRSVRAKGFTFDYTGHLLHLRRPEIRELVLSLVGEDRFLRIDRRSAIFSHGTYTDYPFQVNTYGLPHEVVRACVMGFAETLQRPATIGVDASFASWIESTFGRGIGEHFLTPYNRKLFGVDLETMSADWVSWSIPKPSWPDVVRGALGTNRKVFGYNPTFLYPAAGGIDALPKAFLPRIAAPELGTRLRGVVPERREAMLSSGETVRYSWLVSSVPAPVLAGMLLGAPEEIRLGANDLRHASVRNVNLGFDLPSDRPEHWIYFPEKRFPFYRVGIYSNLCSAAVPSGGSGFYVESSYGAEGPPPEGVLENASVTLLRETGLVPRSAHLVHSHTIDIPHAYVVHDRHRRDYLPRLQTYLRSERILSIGRYGAWEYSAMEDALWAGREAAREISSGHAG